VSEDNRGILFAKALPRLNATCQYGKVCMYTDESRSKVARLAPEEDALEKIFMNTFNDPRDVSPAPIHLRFKADGAHIIKQRMTLLKQLAEKQHDKLSKSGEGKHKLTQFELMDIPESWHNVGKQLMNSDKVAVDDWDKSGECVLFKDGNACIDALKKCDGSDFAECIKAVLDNHARDFPSKVEEMVKGLNPVASLAFLKGLDFKPMMKGDIKVVESVDHWYARKVAETGTMDDDIKDKFEKDTDTQLFLRYLVAFINANPEIINKGYISKSASVYESYIPDDVAVMGVVEQIAPMAGFDDDGTRPIFAPRPSLSQVTMKNYSTPEVPLPFMGPMAVVGRSGSILKGMGEDEDIELGFRGGARVVPMYGGLNEELDLAKQYNQYGLNLLKDAYQNLEVKYARRRHSLSEDDKKVIESNFVKLSNDQKKLYALLTMHDDASKLSRYLPGVGREMSNTLAGEIREKYNSTCLRYSSSEDKLMCLLETCLQGKETGEKAMSGLVEW